MLSPQFVTVDDFNNYWGFDLRAELRTDDNVSDQAEAFLSRVEDRIMNWIDTKTFRNIKWCELTDFQLDQFKKAILTQAMYMWRNGDLSMDSGYDQEAGIVVRQNELANIRICQASMDYLQTAGLFNLVIKNRPRNVRFFGGSFR